MPLLWFGYTSNADAAAAHELIIEALESAKFVGQGRKL